MAEYGAEEGLPEIDFRLPPGLEGGVYANFITIGETASEFTLDFGVLEAPDNPGGEGSSARPFHVTSRVRFPAMLIFELIRSLNAAMTDYERRFGEIRRPEERDG